MKIYTVDLAQAEGLCFDDFQYNLLKDILAKFHDSIYKTLGNMAWISTNT